MADKHQLEAVREELIRRRSELGPFAIVRSAQIAVALSVVNKMIGKEEPSVYETDDFVT